MVSLSLLERNYNATLLFPSGEFYSGSLNHWNERDGAGCQYTADGDVIQRGEWRRDLFVELPDGLAISPNDAGAAVPALPIRHRSPSITRDDSEEPPLQPNPALELASPSGRIETEASIDGGDESISRDVEVATPAEQAESKQAIASADSPPPVPTDAAISDSSTQGEREEDSNLTPSAAATESDPEVVA